MEAIRQLKARYFRCLDTKDWDGFAQVWEEEIEHGIRPMHEALLVVLCRHFGLKRADDELQRLAICLCAMATSLSSCTKTVRVFLCWC